MNLKIIFVILLAGLVLIGCTQNAPQGSSTPATTLAATAIVPTATVLPSSVPPATQTPAKTAAVQEITLSAKQFEFSPSTITVKKGIPVKLTITSTDVTHGFSLPDFNVNEQINPGAPIIIQFTPDKAGTFGFTCNVVCGGGHGGMKGTLVVTDK